MARAQVATETFGAALSSWSQLNPFDGDMVAASGVGRGSASAGGSNRQAARWNGAGTFTDDQYSKLRLAAISEFNSNYSIGVICRASADQDGARDFYALEVQADSAGPNYTTRLFKVVNGTTTQLHSASVAWSVNDTIELEVEGTTVRAMKNGAALGGSFTQTDTSLTTGKPGICGSGGDAGAADGDDWDGGNLTAEGGPPNIGHSGGLSKRRAYRPRPFAPGIPR